MPITYRPLDGSREEIRLLDLLPSVDHASHVRCRVRHVPIKDAQYQALSYAWGNATDREEIEVEYCPDHSRNDMKEVFHASVGASLASALHHLRDKNLVFTLWADAICIDQSNNDEKSVQVQLMAKIYKTASEVIVWLGPAVEGSDNVMDALTEVGKEAERFYFEDPVIGTFSKMADPRTWETDNPLDDRGVSMKSFLDKISGQSSETGQGILPLAELEALTNRPWWTRVWVLQEFSLASTATFACGHRRLLDAHFRLAIVSFIGFYTILVLKAPERQLKMPDYQQSVITKKVARQSLWMLQMQGLFQDQPPSVFQLAMALYGPNSGTSFMATDPKDKIYGLLGIATHELQPNYKYNCADVYSQAMMEFLHSKEMLSLSCCLPQLHNLQLPSWVIDWTSELGASFHAESEFTSAGETQPSLNFDIEGGTLAQAVMSIRGCRVSTIFRKGFSWTECLAKKAEAPDELREALSQIGQSSDMTESSDELEAFFDHQAASDWIRELRKAFANSSMYDSLTYDPVFKTIFCGDTIQEENIEVIQTGFCLLEGTGVADLRMWIEDMLGKGSIRRFIKNFQRKAEHYCYFVSATGLVGYAPNVAQEHDIVVIFFGAPTTFIIRPLDNRRYRFIGPAYVEGIMNGEFMQGNYVEETFKLE